MGKINQKKLDMETEAYVSVFFYLKKSTSHIITYLLFQQPSNLQITQSKNLKKNTFVQTFN